MFEPINLEELFEADPKPMQYLVKPLVPEESLVLISGQAKRNKTFVCLALGISVAYGLPFAGEFLVGQTRRVLMILNEDGTDAVRDRMAKLLLGFNQATNDLPPNRLHVLCRRGFSLEDTDHLDWLQEYVADQHIGLVILDPFAEMFAGEENSERDVKRALQPLKALRDTTKCSVLLSHHQGKPREHGGGRRANTVRGSSYFIGWYDVGLHINAGAEGTPLRIKPEFRNREGMDEFVLNLVADDDAQTLRFEWEAIDKGKAFKEAKSRVLEFVIANPDAITRDIVKKTPGRESTNSAALKQLVSDGEIIAQNGAKAVRHMVAPEVKKS